MTRRLWLLRHGETTSNRDGIFQGQLDSALTERGVEQAERTAARLALTPFRRIYSSDLARAGCTAEAIARVQGIPVSFDPNLREMHYGILQGRRYDAATAILAEHGLAEAWHSGQFHTRGLAPPGGESVRMVRNRVARFLRRLNTEIPVTESGDVLIVAHGGQLRIMLTVLLGLPTSQRRLFPFANCGLTRVSMPGGRPVLDFHNVVLWDAPEAHIKGG